jgi:hypothetical protein
VRRLLPHFIQAGQESVSRSAIVLAELPLPNQNTLQILLETLHRSHSAQYPFPASGLKHYSYRQATISLGTERLGVCGAWHAMQAAVLNAMRASIEGREHVSHLTGRACACAGWPAMQLRMRWTHMRWRSQSRPASHGTHRSTRSADG